MLESFLVLPAQKASDSEVEALMLLFGGCEPNWFVETFKLASTRFTPQGEEEEHLVNLNHLFTS